MRAQSRIFNIGKLLLTIALGITGAANGRNLYATQIPVGATGSGTNQCFRMGWLGGEAGLEVKWVGAKIASQADGLWSVEYDWLAGKLKVLNAGTEIFTGRWDQTGGGGPFELRKRANGNFAGWWSKDTDPTRHLLMLEKTACPNS